MDIWNTNKIISRYNQGEITDPEKFGYFLGNLLLVGFITDIIIVRNRADCTVHSLLTDLIFMALCVTYVYNKSKSKDPSHFIEKYFVLHLPTSVKFYPLFYTSYYGMRYLLMNYGLSVNAVGFVLLIFYFGGFSLYYRYLGRRIREMIG